MKKQAWYALRRTLPPWRFEESLSELAAVVQESKIDEVIVKIDTEEFSHGHPSLEWAKSYQKNLFQIKETLARYGVRYSLNPWITVGHADRGRDDRTRMAGFEFMIGHDGAECRHNACFLSTAWRNYLRELWRIYAETEPYVLWVEDDIRTFNHEPVAFGCFCPLHLKKFAERIGHDVSREELVTAILTPGEPHPWRRVYLDMQRDIMVETAQFLAHCIHDVSPKTHIGLMSSGARQHALEGRDWSALAAALADGGELYSRPPMANYTEDSLRGLYYSQDSIKLTRAVLPANTIEQTECESIPFTRFSKSVTFTFLELALSYAYGSPGVTLNLFDHMGTPMRQEACFLDLLRTRKNFFDALVKAVETPMGYKGVRLIHQEKASYEKKLAAGDSYAALAEDGYEMMLALEGHGIATTYEASPVAALSGETARAVSDTQLDDLLKGGLLLDAKAATILFERGYGASIGLKAIEPPRCRAELPEIVSAEEFHHPDFGGSDTCYMTATLPFLESTVRFAWLTPLPDAQVVSSLVNPDTRRIAPAMIAFANSQGGRVVIHAIDYATGIGAGFFSPTRRRQLQAVVDFLSAGTAPLRFEGDGAYALAFRKETPCCTILGVFNLNLDVWNAGRFVLDWTKPCPSIQQLSPDGNWQSDTSVHAMLEGNRLSINLSTAIPPHDLLVLRLV